jgi:serine/threonine protein kinase
MVIDLNAPTGMASTIPIAEVVDGGTRPVAWKPGACFARYQLAREIGSGAMGVVWAARDLDLDREVALKLIRSSGRSLRELRGRLLGEARAMARLSHANVVAVLDVGTTDDGLFITMEHLDGGTLAEWLEAAPRAWPEVVEKFIEAGRGLAEAHRAGLVHRDFKPENVLLGRDGVARVADFGLAMPAGQPHADEVLEPGTSERKVTEEGVLVGTLGFMAPEQLLGQRATARSDQFGFCVALYEALFGVRPFGGQASEMPAAVLLTAIVEGQIAPPPPERRVPRRLHRLVRRGLACEPEQRWPSMDELVAELEHCLRRRRSWLGLDGLTRRIVALAARVRARAVAWTAARRPALEAPRPASQLAGATRPTRRLQVVKGSLSRGADRRCCGASSISAAVATRRGDTCF